jgi:hypothetical protein
MGYKQMQVTPALDGGEKGFGFEMTVSLAAAGDTDSILIPDDVQNVSVTAQASGGATATIYTTTDLISTIKAAGTITWVAWATGAVTTATGGVFYPVTAIKMTQTGAGASVLSIRAQ